MSTNSATPNILLCIADDLSEANVTIAGSGAARTIEVHNVDNSRTDIVGAMPNTSLLLRNGLYFAGAWAQPACSPTRDRSTGLTAGNMASAARWVIRYWIPAPDSQACRISCLAVMCRACLANGTLAA